uniref:protein-tyrosine-phosphatase n=1 Tax=Paramoeba aestuarina TaxID=180227 RepID=A0A7S4P0B2_9EUKA|mmetsp:Transcript_33993/g.53174  ORF Transcript_33993/g.53174 Transcript_33993/m.53174 type:complete len:155 (+) Transcript_33993:25-489(+)
MAARSTPDEVLPFLYTGSKWHVSPPILKRLNIQWVVNLYNKKAEPPKGIEPEKFLCCPISDNGDSQMAEQAAKFVAHISKAREKEENVLIHCEGGINRAPTVTMIYLIIGEKYTLRDAMNLVKSKRKQTAPHLGYLTQLVEIEKKREGREFYHC